MNYAPGFGWKRSKYAEKTINIAEDGVRVGPYSQDEGEAIVFLGGSTMWGTGVDVLNTIPSLFNKSSVYKYKVINGGETDYTDWNNYQFKLIYIYLEKNTK